MLTTCWRSESDGVKLSASVRMAKTSSGGSATGWSSQRVFEPPIDSSAKSMALRSCCIVMIPSVELSSSSLSSPLTAHLLSLAEIIEAHTRSIIVIRKISSNSNCDHLTKHGRDQPKKTGTTKNHGTKQKIKNI